MVAEAVARIIPVSFKEQMELRYLSYSMSVIVGRALPDVRDGLKPAQRRVLYAMYDAGNTADKPFRKSAKTVGDVLGRFHPHGDAAVYDTMVRMAQDWVMRAPLVEGQGNFGSIDDDPPAAMRYTEARLSPLAGELLRDIEKQTVDFDDNFDNSEQEPTVLPARFPNLLVNGSSGIAVGMATNIPPHNLGEAIDATLLLLEKPDATVEDLMRVLPGPDFPTGGLILGNEGIRQAYETGRGQMVIRAKTHLEDGGKPRLVITELPYGVCKARIVEQIAQLVRERKIDGITDLRDESSQDGIRVVVELRRDADAEAVLRALYDSTQLQIRFGIINLALVGGRPQELSLLDMLRHYIRHQLDVIVRRSRFDLTLAEERLHIVEGLLKALDVIDDVIRIIRSAETADRAREELQVRFGFSEAQARHILDMQLRRLTGLEREKLAEERDNLVKQVASLRALLGSERLQVAQLRKELLEIRQKYADPRRTRIVVDAGDGMALTADDPVVVTVTRDGYVNLVRGDGETGTRRFRRVAGAGRSGDYVAFAVHLRSSGAVHVFTDRGRIYRLDCHQIPEGQPNTRGTSLDQLLPVADGERVTAVWPVNHGEGRYYCFVTRNGQVKRTAVSEYASVGRTGGAALGLAEGDALVGVLVTDGNRELILVSSAGNALRFREEEVRPMGREARGVRGITLDANETVVGWGIAGSEADLMIVTTGGLCKRTPLTEYSTFGRASKGVRTLNFNPVCDGEIVGVAVVQADNEVVLISERGTLTAVKVSDIPQRGRASRGVPLAMGAGERLVGLIAP